VALVTPHTHARTHAHSVPDVSESYILQANLLQVCCNKSSSSISKKCEPLPPTPHCGIGGGFIWEGMARVRPRPSKLRGEEQVDKGPPAGKGLASPCVWRAVALGRGTAPMLAAPLAPGVRSRWVASAAAMMGD
jgi:hypothetical protein